MSPYPDFQSLSPLLYMYTPPPAPAPPNDETTQPGLIILATWMNAPSRLINRYITSYRTQFPNSSILLMTSSLSDLFFTPRTTLDENLRPGIFVIQSLRAGKVVAGIYSNGGAYIFTSFAELYAQATTKALPISGLFIDSAPGSPDDLSSGQRAISTSLPPIFNRSIPLRYLSAVLLYSIFMVSWVYLRLTGYSDPITRLRKRLLDTSLLRVGGKRTYIYSREDRMVDFRAVLSHAKESSTAGWDVRVEEWVGSGHVAHMKQDGERYWGLVKDTFGS